MVDTATSESSKMGALMCTVRRLQQVNGVKHHQAKLNMLISGVDTERRLLQPYPRSSTRRVAM